MAIDASRWAGSLSRSFTESHANGRESWSRHSASSDVFPVSGGRDQQRERSAGEAEQALNQSWARNQPGPDPRGAVLGVEERRLGPFCRAAVYVDGHRGGDRPRHPLKGTSAGPVRRGGALACLRARAHHPGVGALAAVAWALETDHPNRDVAAAALTLTLATMEHGHFWRRSPRVGAAADEPAEIEVAELTQALAAPGWLRDAGATAWLLVGITLFLVGAVWILSLTQTIVGPVIAATVVAAVASPLVSWLQRHRVPRGLGAGLVLLGIVAVGVGMFVAVIGGITSQSGDVSHELSGAQDTIQGWLKDIGVDSSTASDAKQQASSSSTDAFNALVHGLAGVRRRARVNADVLEPALDGVLTPESSWLTSPL